MNLFPPNPAPPCLQSPPSPAQPDKQAAILTYKNVESNKRKKELVANCRRLKFVLLMAGADKRLWLILTGLPMLPNLSIFLRQSQSDNDVYYNRQCHSPANFATRMLTSYNMYNGIVTRTSVIKSGGVITAATSIMMINECLR